MSMPPIFSQFGLVISDFWSARNERERKQITLAAMVAVLGLLYLFLIEPAFVGRERLQKSLPAQRLQAAELQTLATEAAQLGSSSAPPAQEMTRESLEGSLTRTGLKASNIAMLGNEAKLQLASVSFAGLLAWLDEQQKTFRITVVDVNITALTQADTVNATLTLRQQKNE